MSEVPQSRNTASREELLKEVTDILAESEIGYPPVIESVTRVNTLANLKPFTNKRIYSVQFIGTPGSGKSGIVKKLLFDKGFSNLRGAPEPYETRERFEDQLFKYHNIGFSNYQDVRTFKSLIGGLPCLTFL